MKQTGSNSKGNFKTCSVFLKNYSALRAAKGGLAIRRPREGEVNNREVCVLGVGNRIHQLQQN